MRHHQLALASLIALLAACSGAARGPGAAGEVSPAPRARPAPVSPARWLLVDRTFIERDEGGHDHVIAGGRRLAVDRFTVTRAAPEHPSVDGGARMPAWAGAGPSRYVFWRGNKLYGAASFTGELGELAALPAEPRDAFPWMNGVGLIFAGGALVVTSSGATARLGLPTVVEAIAADADRGLAITALGHAWASTDGGKTFRDAKAEVAGQRGLTVRAGAITVNAPGGRPRVIVPSASGEPVTSSTPVRGESPPEDPDRFPGSSASRAIVAAAYGWIAAGDGGVIVAGDGFVGRLDLDTRSTTSLAALDPALRDAQCVAFRAADAPLLLCSGESLAAVVDLTGAPRLERTFDTDGAAERGRFVGTDGEALGYLGPCEGPRAPSEQGDRRDGSRHLRLSLCVRAGRDVWIEHHLDAGDASGLIAWIPRANGGAAALVTSPGAVIDDRRRVSVRGALRVVRVAESEPPLSLGQASWSAEVVLDRALRIGADDVIEGWLATTAGPTGAIAVSIDAAGRARAAPAPLLAGPIISAGKLALTRSEDDKLWETVDGGRRWTEVEPPPDRDAAPSVCSPAGCRVGAFVRLGWSDREARAPRVDPPPRVDPDPPRGRRAPPPPVVRLGCTFDGPPASKRIVGSEGLGVTPAPVPRGGVPLRVGTLGGATMPIAAPRVAPTGNLDLTWVAPLDTDARVRRASAPLTLLDGGSSGHRPGEMRLGWLLASDGGLEAIALGPSERCPERLLAHAGVVRAMGGCAEDATVAADVGGRTYALRATYASIELSVAEITHRGKARAASPSAVSSLLPLGRVTLGGPLRGFVFAIGARAGGPVLVMHDLVGEAALATIDPARGTLGPEERMRSLADAQVGSDAACAPRPDDARVVLPIDGAIGLDRELLRGLTLARGGGVAIVRWSRDRACVDAIELPVRDERFEDSVSSYERPGTVRKIIARWTGAPRATLFSMTAGAEMRQRLSCPKTIGGP